MKITIIKHILKHKILLSRSIKAIGSNLFKLFLIDKLAFLVPERFRKLFKILCWFGAKFTLISTVFGVIYSILAEIFSWTFNYKTIIDLILGLLLTFETGLFTELKVIFNYYYAKFFDWWISKVETSDKEKAKSLREKIFKQEPISVDPINPKEKARMNKEYLDNLKKQSKYETWIQRIERESKELYNKNKANLNINITPNYHNLNSWFSLDTMKWIMYGLIAAGVLYSYYSFFTTVNNYITDSFITVYNSLKDFIQNPITYVSGATGYLWVNSKEILKRYLLRRFWPFTMWFGQDSLRRSQRDDITNNPENTQGEDNNYPSETMNELIGPDAPTMEVTDEPPIKPDYNNYKSKEDFERIVNEQFDISQRWNEPNEQFEDRVSRIESGLARPGDLSPESETISEAKDRYFKSPSPEPINETGTSSLINDPIKAREFLVDMELLEKYSNMTEREYIESFKEQLVEFTEANKDSEDPRVRAFINWAKGEAKVNDLTNLIKIPKNFTDEWLQAQYNKFFYEFLEVESLKDAKTRLTKSLVKK